MDTPEFSAEEHLGRPLTLLCAVLGFVMHTLAMLPGMCATFAIMGESAATPMVLSLPCAACLPVRIGWRQGLGPQYIATALWCRLRSLPMLSVCSLQPLDFALAAIAKCPWASLQALSSLLC